MSWCEVCGNDYDKPIEIKVHGKLHVFDCFECAIQALAPVCGHCRVRIVGHGVEGVGAIYCSAHCATRNGESGVSDHAFHGLSGVR